MTDHLHPIEEIAARAEAFYRFEVNMQDFKLATGYPNPWSAHSLENLDYIERGEILDAWISWCGRRHRALVLVRPHRWRRCWPGNFCEACGIDDPGEDSMNCPNCKWLKFKDIGEEPQPIVQLCAFHHWWTYLPCEGYNAPRRPDPRNVPVARRRDASPSRWFLASGDSVCSHGRRWWERCGECEPLSDPEPTGKTHLGRGDDVWRTELDGTWLGPEVD